MTEEPKICPFMSRPDNYNIRLFCSTQEEFDRAKEEVKNIPFIPCQKDRCAAWGPKLEKHANCKDGCWTNGCRLIP